jgi:hypothetical protein
MAALIVEGEEAPPRGWVSTGFGRRVAAPAVVESGVVELPATLLTAIIPSEVAAAVRVGCPAGGWDGGAVFEIDTAEGRETVFMGAPRLAGSEWSFSGTVGFVSVRGDGIRAWGLGIDEWKRSGSDVTYESVVNLLSDL